MSGNRRDQEAVMTVFFFQAEDGIRYWSVTGVQTCALPICVFGLRSALERRRSKPLAELAVERQRRYQCPPAGWPVVRSQGRAQGGHAPRRSLLDAADTVRLCPRLGQDEGAQHASTDELERIDRLEQLAASDLDRDVVHPDPETILDPLQARWRIDRLRPANGRANHALAVPENHGILDTVGQLLSRHELEVDVEEGRSIERDEEPRLAHMIAGKRRQERC